MSLDGLATSSCRLITDILAMFPFRLCQPRGRPLNILCLGAHSDDLEIGCGGAMMEFLKRYKGTRVCWVVLSALDDRAKEAKLSAEALLRSAAEREVVLGKFTDSHFPSELRGVKAFFEQIKRFASPDIILTHHLEDRHQDHRLTAELTWQTWRNHLILEYEIPKYDGDLGQPNLYIPLAKGTAARKVRHLLRHFATQKDRVWFRPDTFDAIMRLRGIECHAVSGMAEAFHVRKAVF